MGIVSQKVQTWEMMIPANVQLEPTSTPTTECVLPAPMDACPALTATLVKSAPQDLCTTLLQVLAWSCVEMD